jgi:hypothetical protein
MFHKDGQGGSIAVSSTQRCQIHESIHRHHNRKHNPENDQEGDPQHHFFIRRKRSEQRKHKSLCTPDPRCAKQ